MVKPKYKIQISQSIAIYIQYDKNKWCFQETMTFSEIYYRFGPECERAYLTDYLKMNDQK